MDLDMWLALLGLFKLLIVTFLRAKEDRVFGGLTCIANVLSIRVNRKGQSIRDGSKKPGKFLNRLNSGDKEMNLVSGSNSGHAREL